MGDNLRFFSSASPDSSHGHGHTPDGYGPGFAGPWIEPGAYSDYGPEDYAARAEEELQRLISTDGPTTSWLYSDYDSDSQADAHAPTTGPAPIQREMTVGSANDPLEEEADAVAERVMRNPRDFYLDPRVSSFQPYQIGGRGEQVVARLARMAQEEEAAQLKAEAPEISRLGEQDEEMQYKSLQRNLAGMDEDAKETLGYTHAFEKGDEEEDMGTTTSMYMRRDDAASPEGGTVSPELQRRIEGVRNSGGEKLPESEREFFESRMGHDFGDVRIHTGSDAAQVSRDVNAKAFTIGRDVVFGEGEYKPGTPEGRRLMAHELTHTVQQGAAKADGSIQRYAAPTDWLDYLSLTFNAAELAYIEYALPEGEYKNFRRLLNALFWAIDLLFAALPGAGGGGAVLRIAGQGGGALVWKAIPQSMRMQAISTAARQVGIPTMRASQLINGYFDVAAQTAPSKEVAQSVNDLMKLTAQAVQVEEIDKAASKEPGVWGPKEIPSKLYPDLTQNLADYAKLLTQTGGPNQDPDRARKIAELLQKIRAGLQSLRTEIMRTNSSTLRNHTQWLEKFFNSLARPNSGRMSP